MLASADSVNTAVAGTIIQQVSRNFHNRKVSILSHRAGTNNPDNSKTGELKKDKMAGLITQQPFKQSNKQETQMKTSMQENAKQPPEQATRTHDRQRRNSSSKTKG